MKKKKSSRSPGRTGNKRRDRSAEAGTADWHIITDIEQVKLLASDLRLRILGEFADAELTAKQVAERLGEPPTKLYRHVDALAQHGLIVPTRSEQKRGTTQKFYRAIARRFRVDENCFAGSESGDETQVGLVFRLLSSINGELSRATPSLGDEYVAAVSSLTSFSAAAIESVGEKLIAAFSDIVDEGEKKSKRAKDKKQYRISILIHPAQAEDDDSSDRDND